MRRDGGRGEGGGGGGGAVSEETILSCSLVCSRHDRQKST